jgi:hypothetical protein
MVGAVVGVGSWVGISVGGVVGSAAWVCWIALWTAAADGAQAIAKTANTIKTNPFFIIFFTP